LKPSPRESSALSWWRESAPSSPLVLRSITLAIIGLAACTLGPSGRDQRGTLSLSIVDGSTGQPTPARVEVIDGLGNAHVAEDALLVGQGYTDRAHPWEGNAEDALALLSRDVENPYTLTTQFYSTGTSRLSLAPGRYELRVFKGIE
jgi:hypothetical protein